MKYIDFTVSIVVMAIIVTAPPKAKAQFSEHFDTDEIRTSDEPSEENAPRSDHPVSVSENTPELKQAAELIMEQTNEFRSKHDLPAVQRNESLQKAASYFAQYMARTGRYGHTADGQRPSDRAKQHGYQMCIVSENIAYAYRSRGFDSAALADQFVNGWIESKEHRENMLGEYVTDTAVAVARDDQTNYHFAVQMFGRPRSEAIEFTLVNDSGEEVDYQIITNDQVKKSTLPARMIVRHTRCRPPKLKLENSTDEPVDIDTGDRFIVDGKGTTLDLQRQSAGNNTETD